MSQSETPLPSGGGVFLCAEHRQAARFSAMIGRQHQFQFIAGSFQNP
jgi:hypothetical protein